MYFVKTYLAPSLIDGIGVFAGTNIPAGTLLWDFVEGFDQVFDDAHVKSLPRQAQEYIKKHSFRHKGKIYLCGDHGVFANHSESPNSKNWPDPDGHPAVAARDIKKGEEITCNYHTFDDAATEKLGGSL